MPNFRKIGGWKGSSAGTDIRGRAVATVYIKNDRHSESTGSTESTGTSSIDAPDSSTTSPTPTEVRVAPCPTGERVEGVVGDEVAGRIERHRPRLRVGSRDRGACRNDARPGGQ